jgi:hypothetical protein
MIKESICFVKFVFVVVAAAILMASAAMGQTTGAGTITGTLTDPNGGVIPNAMVVLRNTDTGTERPIATSAAGIYVAQFLPPGHYEITASKTGFARVVRTDLTLQVGQTLTVDLAMPIQTTTETVTVTGQTSVVDTEKTEMSQVVSQTQKEYLPIAGRRWENFALLTPGVTTDGGSGLISYRGISGLYNQSSVDGTNNSQAFFSESKGRTNVPYVYSMDSIQEFQVTSSNYSAELGQAAGGVVNAVTKSGTNGLHGDLFYYLRYPTLNALDPISKAQGTVTQPVHQQQQFGGSVGGPIKKDKLLYFLTYDGSRKVNPIVYTSSTKTFPLPCPVPITASQCATANNFVTSQLGAFPRFQNQDVAFGKLDYQLTPTNHLNASFNFDNFRAPNSYRTNPTQNNESVSSNGQATFHERNFVANWDSIIRPTVINAFHFQWSRDLEVYSANGTGPFVNITNVMMYGLPNALPRPAFPDEHRLQFGDTISLTRGKHTFKTGVDYNAIHELLINLFQGGGIYNYTGASVFNSWVADVFGVNLGDGLTGRHWGSFVQVTDPVTGVGKDDFYDQDFAGFFEDSWKARSNLTLNLGIRYDVQLIPQPPRPNTRTPLTTLYTSTINIDKNNVGPRIGIAWQPAKNTVMRVGYGIFYGKTTNSTYYATRVENGSFQQTYNCSVSTCPALNFPNVIFVPPGGPPSAPFAGTLTPRVTPITLNANTATTRGQSPNWVNPLVHEGEVTFERELPGSIAVSASYLVSRGLRLPMFFDSNLAPSTTTKTYTVANSSGVAQSTITVPFYTSRIDPTGSILTGFSDVNSWYNAFVLSFHKRMDRGLEFLANYTVSKTVDGGQVPGVFGTFNGTDTPIDPYNRKLEYALSDLDQRHRFVGNVVWIPPYAKNLSNKVAKNIFDGFIFSTIVTVAAGSPITPIVNGNPAGGIDGGLTGGAVNNSGTPPSGTSAARFPGVPRNSLTGSGLKNVDVRISRQFRIRERYTLTFTGEAFNLFNFTNVIPPTGGGTSSAYNTTEYNLSGTTLIANPLFLAPTNTSNGLYGPRQLQISGRFTF